MGVLLLHKDVAKAAFLFYSLYSLSLTHTAFLLRIYFYDKLYFYGFEENFIWQIST
jgi:hypothetical protein